MKILFFIEWEFLFFYRTTPLRNYNHTELNMEARLDFRFFPDHVTISFCGNM